MTRREQNPLRRFKTDRGRSFGSSWRPGCSAALGAPASLRKSPSRYKPPRPGSHGAWHFPGLLRPRSAGRSGQRRRYNKAFALVEPNDPTRHRSLPTQYLAKRTSIVCSLEQSAVGSFLAASARGQCLCSYSRLDHRQVGDRVAISYLSSGPRLAGAAPIR